MAAIFISFLVVAIMMRSVLNPLIIMVSLPLASIGAFLGLLIGGYTLGVSGMMGMLMLVGIVLTNAIVLIAVVEQLRKEGMSTHDALVQGGQTRLRPILMTALTTIFAMVPLALGVESGTIIAGELAVVVIGGLFSSTLLTLAGDTGALQPDGPLPPRSRLRATSHRPSSGGLAAVPPGDGQLKGRSFWCWRSLHLRQVPGKSRRSAAAPLLQIPSLGWPPCHQMDKVVSERLTWHPRNEESI